MKELNSQVLRDAAQSSDPVSGYNHDLYRYPARFAPSFVRAAILAFSEPGDVIYDPFIGGGTTLVEARLSGRRAVGTDISELAIFISKVKTTVLSPSDIKTIQCAIPDILDACKLRDTSRLTRKEYYHRNINCPKTWPLQRTLERAIGAVSTLSRKRQQDFVRCVLLRTAQWALDCRQNPPSASHFREKLSAWLEEGLESAAEYRRGVQRADRGAPRVRQHRTTCWKLDALGISQSRRLRQAGPYDLIVTSPPYAGTHVLYHRWQVMGRRETPAPFWVAGAVDGHGGAHYTLGDYRYHHRDEAYFSKIQAIFSQIHPLLRPGALVVQMVGFSGSRDNEKRYNRAMRRAGYALRDTFRRQIPGRRFYASLGHVPKTAEHVLIYQRTTT